VKSQSKNFLHSLIGLHIILSLHRIYPVVLFISDQMTNGFNRLLQFGDSLSLK